MTITASEVADGATSNNATLSLIFTSSESTANFVEGDIDTSNGSLSNFTGSGTTYEATFTPGADGACTIDVVAGAFTDVTGNNNTAATQFNWTYDGTSPTMAITASGGVSDGSTSNDATLSLTFTSSESTTNFVEADITVTNGGLSSFAGSGTTYTATFTPAAQGACTIDVAASAYTDAVGNTNPAATQFNWTFDNISPSMTITASEVSDGDTSNDATLSLTFTSSESTTNFAEADIDTTNGSLSSFAGSGTTYTATFTPAEDGACTIDVDAGAFTDAGTNDNIAATTFNWTFDSTKPTMTITASQISDGGTYNAPLSLTFLSSESTTNFAEADIGFSNGSLSSFAGSGTTYTATFTPSAEGACTIDVGADVFTDAVGNNNTAATQFNWTFDDTKPTMAITASEVSDGDTSNDATLSLTFTSSESTANFIVGDIDTTNGDLSSFAGSGTTYTATFTPNTDGACTIDVAGGAYTDAAGNDNIIATQFNWTFDSTAPTLTSVSIASSNTIPTLAKVDDVITLTLEADTPIGQPVVTFLSGGATINDGSIEYANTSGNTWTAKYTANILDTEGSITYSIAFSDIVGNAGTAVTSGSGSVTFDRTLPTMIITALEVSDGGSSNDATLSLTFTSSESTANFVEGDIGTSNGSLSNFTGSGTTYEATFTPGAEGACTIDVDAGAYTDVTGNNNTAATQFNWTYDNTSPSMAITAAEVSDGGSYNAAISLTFTSSESTADFTEADITVTNGSLSSFAGSGTTYTATFTPAAEGACTIDVVGGVYEDGAGNIGDDASQFNWTYDNTSPTLTSVSIASSNTIPTLAKVDDVITLTLAADEPIVINPVVTFLSGGATIADGSIEYANTSGNTWTAKYTANILDTEGFVTYSIAFSDIAGNAGIAVTSGSGSVAFDRTSPTMVITSDEVDDGDTSDDATISLRFTSSESTANFVEGDIDTSNGSLSNFIGSGTIYTATFTPDGDGACTIDVGAGAYTDVTGNNNTAATQFNWTYDTTGPTMTILSDHVVTGGEYEEQEINLTFTSSETTLEESFVEADIGVTNCTISNFAVSSADRIWTANCRATTEGDLCRIDVGAGAFTDPTGNNNTAANFRWTWDSGAPLIDVIPD